MCINCVKEEFPDRESLCIEHGSYLINFKECYNCGERNLKIANNAYDETEGEETTTYEHVCAECEHVIAVHDYTFRVEDEYQLYEMSCQLCGSAEDQRSIMPIDPRGSLK